MSPAPIETDALIVGAGPTGLFQAFQLGLLEIKAHIVDVLHCAGGQCVELYPDKPIYDIPGIAVCTGRELTHKLLQQIAPFNPAFHFGQEVVSLARQPDGRLLVETSGRLQFLTKTVFIAAGVGGFKPRSIAVAGLDKFLGSQLFYDADSVSHFCGRNVAVFGGEEAAIDAAIALCNAPADQRCASVSLIHRREVLQAPDATLDKFHALRDAGALQFIVGQPTGFQEVDGSLTGIDLMDADGKAQQVPVDRLLVQFGLSPKLGPIAHWGLAMQRRQLVVNTESYATGESGIFAVGDINTYPGKKKLIICGFHEATLAAHAAAALVFPDKHLPLQYTTTSPRLHQLLGVHSKALD